MTEEQIQYLPLEKIECRPQVRQHFDEDAILGLARSIQETDRLLQPIRVRRDGSSYVVLDGERRVRAAKKLGLATVAAIIEDKELCLSEVLHRQLVLDCQKVHLTVVERANAIRSLIQESGWSASQVAQRVGISPATVTKLLAVLELPNEAQEQVAVGTLGMSTAYAIARTTDPNEKSALIEDAANGRLTRNGVAERAKARKRKRRSSQSKHSRSNGRQVSIAIGHGCSLSVHNRSVTLVQLRQWIDAFLERLARFESKDTALLDAIRVLESDAVATAADQSSTV